MEKFSSTLKIGDGFEDFISPGLECIKPVNTKKSSKVGINKSKGLQKVEITLNDCLSCAGCITSAETVLVTSQSHQQLLNVVKKSMNSKEEERMVFVASCSPQALASIAVEYELSHEQALYALTNYFKKKYNFSYVLNTNFARQISLLESSNEFIERYKASKQMGENEQNKNLPLFTSACPGWVCYVEKTHGKLVIPYMSKVKSGQQIMGSLVKKLVADHYKINPSQVYHVTLMPCYDKKLEASREDFYNDLLKTKEVDLVLTPYEVFDVLKEDGSNLTEYLYKDHHENNVVQKEHSIENEFLNETLLSSVSKTSLPTTHNGGSGGYLEFVFKSAAENLFGLQVDEIEYVPTRRDNDFKEVKLKNSEGEVLLTFAQAYGFRSIQNLILKMKRGKCNYDYIEVMACPKGCLNGGGQIRSSEGRQKQDEKLENVKKFYNQLSTEYNKDLLTQLLYRQTSQQTSILDKEDVYTDYHAIEKTESISIKW